jgi:hypothetical protein
MLKFQEEMLKFQAMVIARFDKQEEFNNYVISRFDKLDSRLDNIVKLNNLKE